MRNTVRFLTLLSLNLMLNLKQTQQSQRAKRFLIFPRQAPTRHQFIAGIGIPADLSFESLTIGHVLKAEFFLPYNASVYRQNPFLPEYEFQTTSITSGGSNNMAKLLLEPSQMRWQIYAYLEHVISRYDNNGHDCLLQAICEANSLHFDRNFSVVAELLHLLLTPSSTLNALIKATEARDYLNAEVAGNNGEDCDIYDCKMRLISWISQVMHL